MLKQEFGDTKEVIHGVWDALLIEIAPTLIVLLQETRDLTLQTKQFGQEWLNVSDAILVGVDAIHTSFTLLTQPVMWLKSSFKEIKALMTGNETQYRVALEEIRIANEELADALSGKWVMDIKRRSMDLETALSKNTPEYDLQSLKDLINNTRREANDLMGKGVTGTGWFSKPEKEIFPGAFYKGTREAAVEAAKAGGRDGELAFEKKKVKELEDLNAGVRQVRDEMRGVRVLMGADAAID